MASADAPRSPSPPGSEEFVNILTCPVCLDSYKDPKTLNCLHSFCCGCLERCKKPYRKEICCPVCKNSTILPSQGVKGLKPDFRIQQIKDFLDQQLVTQDPVSPPSSPENRANASTSSTSESKTCDLCRAQSKQSSVSHHCSQCAMFYCIGCMEKHQNNQLFLGHQVTDLKTPSTTDMLFCKSHVEQQVKYFCKVCSNVLCTICIFEHPPEHGPTQLDPGMLEKNQQELKEHSRKIKSKIAEVESKVKYLETMKQSHQKALYEAQRSIRGRAVTLINKIKDEEKKLLQDVQIRATGKLRDIGMDLLGEMNFHKTYMENLHTDLEDSLKASPVKCLATHEELIARAKATLDVSLPAVHLPRVNNVVRFSASDESVGVLVGQLQECSFSRANQEEIDAGSSGDSPKGSLSPTRPLSPCSPGSRPKRIHSILNALSTGKQRSDLKKIGKVKAFSSINDAPLSPNAINADELLTPGTSSSTDDEPLQSTSSAMLDTPPASPSNDEVPMSPKPKLLYKVDQVGGWPGKISSPTSLAYLPDGHIIVAECENRLQVFNEVGHSVRVLGWGKIRPQCVAVGQNNKILVTDKKDACIKVFSLEGEQVNSWGQGMFSQPSGIAQMSNGNFVITDIDKNMVSIHSSDGALITQFGSWGGGDYQFNGPVYVTIGHQDCIVVSDSCNNCIKMYDHTGGYLRKISGTGSNHGGLRRPQGVCADLHGNIFVADHDNHRVVMFNRVGLFLRNIASKHDGIKYPCDIKIRNEELVVVETHNGFLAKDPHHAVKKFIIQCA